MSKMSPFITVSTRLRSNVKVRATSVLTMDTSLGLTALLLADGSILHVKEHLEALEQMIIDAESK